MKDLPQDLPGLEARLTALQASWPARPSTFSPEHPDFVAYHHAITGLIEEKERITKQITKLRHPIGFSVRQERPNRALPATVLRLRQ